ncbi:NADP-dependent phosphogluconate dehydrogenase [Shewanella sp. 202IG2-18]|uniref:NADP-dependent phosphogluconate dehydrogenase n=1 Tax=Parashewanella hymeniacidonis TaxID=2807618 RepID=UPI0019600A65|nr:NADP-dependent phosphogluconate dehydrogenase [Parashewanella hymeniacidonis]MBM7073293.1 NADP-dependent phosphogluconate dehydrogenase [Parashewanella hymeniacidonis]
MNNHSPKHDIGVIGLGVMGKNLALNIADNGFTVAAFDLDGQKIEQLINQARVEEETYNIQPTNRISGYSNIKSLVESLTLPRKVLLSIPAGRPVEMVCQALIKAGLEITDIVVDTGNSLWTDTVEREKQYKNNFMFFSSAVSGGEVGARFGPCLMPSGSEDAWKHIAPIWQAIAAKVDAKTGLPIERTQPGQTIKEGESCAAYIGEAGAGHYVKMVHNGIEYADMQLICEAYHILSTGIGFSASEIGEIFGEWNQGKLNSYLMEITADILKQKDLKTEKPLVEMILDRAGQKGTGLWTAVSSLQIGAPAPTIAEAVFARAISNQKAIRIRLNQSTERVAQSRISESEKLHIISDIQNALYCAKVCSYAQGFQLMAAMAKEQNWHLDFANIAKIWRAGCIIRASFLQQITQTFEQQAGIEHLLLSETFLDELSNAQHSWRKTVSFAVLNAIPTPCISSALNYFDAFSTETLPANLLQAQRDYFGAHTYERVDAKKGEKFHTEWSSTTRSEIKL